MQPVGAFCGSAVEASCSEVVESSFAVSVAVSSCSATAEFAASCSCSAIVESVASCLCLTSDDSAAAAS
jgi:hypothetical protein